MNEDFKKYIYKLAKIPVVYRLGYKGDTFKIKITPMVFIKAMFESLIAAIEYIDE